MFLVAAAMTAAMTVSAQSIEQSKFFDNWYVGINGGVQTKTTKVKWMKNLNPNAGLRIGKNITPVFGLAVEDNIYFSNKPFKSIGTAVRYSNLSLLGTVNLSNLFAGYKGEPRCFEIVGLYGLGWFHTFGTASNEASFISDTNHLSSVGRINRMSSKVAIDFAFNFGSQKQWQLYIEPSLTYLFLGDYENSMRAHYGYGLVTSGDQPAYNLNNSAFQLNAGLVYKFKNSNGTHNFKLCDKLYTQAQVDALNDEINALRNRKPEVVTKEVVKEVPAKEVVREVKVEDLLFVTFAQGKSTLTADAKKALDEIKSDRHVQIVGTASPEGNAELNQRLSQARADVVADYLKARGVTVDEATGKGVQGTTSNRLAVVYVK